MLNTVLFNTILQHEKTFIYRVCIEKNLKEVGICELALSVKISRQILYQWMKRFLMHLKYLLTALLKRVKAILGIFDK